MSCFSRLGQALTRCEFAKDCKQYNPQSYTCERGDQDYCGTYKKRKYGRVIVCLTIPRHAQGKGEGFTPEEGEA